MHVILVSNYQPDKQYSMLQFARIIQSGLEERGIAVTNISPRPYFTKYCSPQNPLFKWLAYLDKYIVFPRTVKSLSKKIANSQTQNLYHICDHSNAVYLPATRDTPTVLTCHDLTAIRAAKGEFPKQPISLTGRILQSWILKSIPLADCIVCDSHSTAKDLNRIANGLRSKISVAHLCFEVAKKQIPRVKALKRLPQAFHPIAGKKLILHVGNNSWYKNRNFVLETFLALEKKNPNLYRLCLAGAPLDSQQSQWIKDNQLDGKIMNPVSLSDTELEALYNISDIFVFPSLYEGFGWPPLEAQACGIPVISTSNGSLKEVLNGSAMVPDKLTPESWALAIYSCLANTDIRNHLIDLGKENIKRFNKEKLIDQYLSIYNKALLRT